MRYSTHELVQKIIGSIIPVGDEHIDAGRLTNLQELITLVDLLLGDISMVAAKTTAHQSSIKRMAIRANDFLKEIKEAD